VSYNDLAGVFEYFLFSLLFGEDEPNWTNIFFKWVGDGVSLRAPLKASKKPFNSEEKSKRPSTTRRMGGSLKNFFLDVPRNLVNG